MSAGLSASSSVIGRDEDAIVVAEWAHSPAKRFARHMQELEKQRYAEALIAFAEGFARGFAGGERALAAGLAPLIENESFPIRIDVPRDEIVDGEWQRHVPRFNEAGFKAARYARRRGAIALDAEVSSPDLRDNRVTCPWFVVDLG